MCPPFSFSHTPHPVNTSNIVISFNLEMCLPVSRSYTPKLIFNEAVYVGFICRLRSTQSISFGHRQTDAYLAVLVC
jgi:hypothetical protein